MKSLIDLPVRFIFAVVAFTFGGWIGWLGILLIILKLIGVIHWPWWLAALPLEYGVLYSLYMTIDGALYRAGLKGVGGYARFTQAPLVAQHEQSKIQEIVAEGPERIGATIDAWSEDPNRRPLAQALLDSALEPYFLLQLAMFANKKVNAHVTIKKWKDAGLTLPAEGTPEFFPYGDSDTNQHRALKPGDFCRFQPNKTSVTMWRMWDEGLIDLTPGDIVKVVTTPENGMCHVNKPGKCPVLATMELVGTEWLELINGRLKECEYCGAIEHKTSDCPYRGKVPYGRKGDFSWRIEDGKTIIE